MTDQQPPADDAAQAAREQLLAAMESAADLVATITGLRQQFLDSGWDLVSASSLVVAAQQQYAAAQWLEVLRFYPPAQTTDQTGD
jgi:hypothetical protein